MTNKMDYALGLQRAEPGAASAREELRALMYELGFSDTAADAGAELREIMLACGCAIKEVRARLDILNEELSVRHSKNAIESISSRIKTLPSIAQKLRARGQALTLESISENIDDIAGVRVICPFLEDIYTVADMLLRQDGVVLKNRKDYIACPKPNGYRSLHLLVDVPVFFSGGRQMVKVEIQIRTVAMDFWASLEHQMRYKKVVGSLGEIESELLECSDIIADVDKRMQNIRNMISAQE